MVNIFDRKDIDYFKDSGELQQIEQRYYYELWPRIPKSMRETYVEKERSSLRKFHDILWKQLRPIKDFTTSDILNNEFKLDFYGNVVSRHNERYSKTSWDVDHIFPFSRGGLSLIGNLRIVQSRANSVVKKDRIDTLIERKEMRIGKQRCAHQSLRDLGCLRVIPLHHTFFNISFSLYVGATAK